MLAALADRLPQEGRWHRAAQVVEKFLYALQNEEADAMVPRSTTTWFTTTSLPMIRRGRSRPNAVFDVKIHRIAAGDTLC